MLESPRQAIWYVEARAWNGTRHEPGNIPTGEGSVNKGSAVAVRLARMDEVGAGSSPASFRNYLLTCAHVVRSASTSAGHEPSIGWGPLLGEILCWAPGTPWNDVPRKSGEVIKVGAKLARVCHAVYGDGDRPASLEGSVPEASRQQHYDWVLLEVVDAAFQAAPAVERWASSHKVENEIAEAGNTALPIAREPFDLYGYPGGVLEPMKAIEPAMARGFRQDRTPPYGMLNLEGPEESRPGMSGGGIFDQDGRLVGLHRAANDSQMFRPAISAQAIHRHLVEAGFRLPPAAPASPRQSRERLSWARLPSLVAIIGLVALLGLLIWWFGFRKKTGDPHVITISARMVYNDAEYDVSMGYPGLRVGFKPVGWHAPQMIPGTSGSDGAVKIQVHLPVEATRLSSLPGHLFAMNAEGPLKEQAPLVLVPYGLPPAHEGNPHERLEVLDLKLKHDASFVEVMSRDRWQMRSLTDTIASGPLPPNASLVSSVQQAVVKANLDPAGEKRAVESWVNVLKRERPVLAIEKAGDYFPADEASRLTATAASVCALYRDDQFSGTGFAVASNLVAVPSFALNADSKLSVGFGSSAKETTRRHKAKVVWRDEALRICLLEIEGQGPSSLPLCEEWPEDSAGWKVAVIGYPVANATFLPAEFSELFTAVEQQKCVMPGQATVADQSTPKVQYDASTISGTSGAPVLDVQSGIALAVHMEGKWEGSRKSNFGTPCWLLAENAEARELITSRGGRFVPPPQGATRLVPGAGSNQPIIIPYDPGFVGVQWPFPAPPAAARAETIALNYVYFSLLFNTVRRMPWVAAINFDRSAGLNFPREMERWRLDPRVPVGAQLTEQVFVRNSFDRGHVAGLTPLRWGPRVVAQSAVQSAHHFTNVTPQYAYFNRTTWTRVEQHIYHKLYPDSPRVSIFTGPVLATDDVEVNGVRVPRSYWILACYRNPQAPDRPFLAAYLAQQYTGSTEGTIHPVSREDDPGLQPVRASEIEQLTGLKLRIPKQAILSGE